MNYKIGDLFEFIQYKNEIAIITNISDDDVTYRWLGVNGGNRTYQLTLSLSSFDLALHNGDFRFLSCTEEEKLMFLLKANMCCK